MLVLAGFFRLFGDLLAFIGPWCIEVIVEYAYRQIELKKYGIGNTTGAGSSAVTYSPIPTGNGSDVTLPMEPEEAVSINEPRREKTNVLVSDLVRHKPGCTATEDG